VDPTEDTASNNPSVLVMAVAKRYTGYRFFGNVFIARCLETDVYLSACCIAKAVLVRFEVSVQQQVNAPQ
jgi:hypothetical protein